MASRANVDDRRDSRRRSAVIAVARSAGRSAQVSTDNERVIVDALVILGELIGRNLVSTHVAGVGMAASARVCDVYRVNSGM